MRIAELKTLDGKLCVFVDAPQAESGTLRLLDDEDLRRLNMAHEKALQELLAAQNLLGDTGNDIQGAIDMLEHLPQF